MSSSMRISLAAKCQILFGAAVLLILIAALGVVGARMQALVEEVPLTRARDLANVWLSDDDHGAGEGFRSQGATLRVYALDEAEQLAEDSVFVRTAVGLFKGDPRQREHTIAGRNAEDRHVFRYARALRQDEQEPAKLTGLMVVDLDNEAFARERVVNRIYIVAAGLVAGLLAIAVFWFITTRIVLSPVRTLRRYARKVSEGDLNIRSDINTGDEFEQLSEMFNQMLENLKLNQDELRSANMSLDLKLGELAESNVALYEANRIKGDFLANVSHELRTPLNSIIGFAEMLQDPGGENVPPDEKRQRYLGNIITSSRRLLDLINDLLDLAKIEAGRASVQIGSVSPADTAEGLLNLMRPEATQRGIALRLRVEPSLPMLQTDAGKLQQILFNFLSNAVKFTPDRGAVTLAVVQVAGKLEEPEAIRFSVTDTGPGIAEEDHPRVFEKFNQLDPSVTRAHGGTGLGLTISRELAEMLQGTIELESQLGQGATFSLTLPIAPKARTNVLMPEEAE